MQTPQTPGIGRIRTPNPGKCKANKPTSAYVCLYVYMYILKQSVPLSVNWVDKAPGMPKTTINTFFQIVFVLGQNKNVSEPASNKKSNKQHTKFIISSHWTGEKDSKSKKDSFLFI